MDVFDLPDTLNFSFSFIYRLVFLQNMPLGNGVRDEKW